MKKKDLKKMFKGISDEDLLQRLANACFTHYQALGHNKADMNWRLMETMKEELKRRGMEVPSHSELNNRGIFNGEGAS